MRLDLIFKCAAGLIAGAVLSACAVLPTAELSNGPWQVTGVSNGQALVATKEAGASMNLLLDGSGRASGQSGCNRFSAGYTQSGTQLQFSQAAGTRMMCVQPEGVMQFEAWMLAALNSVAAWSMDGDVLTLRTATGATALTLKK